MTLGARRPDVRKPIRWFSNIKLNSGIFSSRKDSVFEKTAFSRPFLPVALGALQRPTLAVTQRIVTRIVTAPFWHLNGRMPRGRFSTGEATVFQRFQPEFEQQRFL